MACALTTGEDRRVDTDPVVPYTYDQIWIPKSDFNLNMAGLGVLIRVADRLACDAIGLVTNDGSQLSRSALHDYAVLSL